jgi:hypothetical protein
VTARQRRALLLWIVLPLAVGAVAASMFDPGVFDRREHLSAVFLEDGQAYFGHLDENALTGTLVLRDVYYLQDARNSTADYAVALVKRGTEVHEPVSEMRIRREKVLAVERVSVDSPVAKAIAAQRALEAAAR